ncbi:MAG: hypothetical protein UV05_C0011G0023 [candidate division CPR1 bacterium GW2011_GWA2_42_17]|uniref:Uncharacterized protein n=1 Tax=candidate division CPR1 bacterium GW2011_GWA2_42_17 TaxID=1618341 RepID=A0A0G0Z626_9BACT|nr:MAG: hypothetical protein UV05_C0011G0023 [candidate division CPR1 bacterium GW2011_GWA2_42_17]
MPTKPKTTYQDLPQQAVKLVKRSDLPDSQKTFWLEKISSLPKVLLNRLMVQLQRIELVSLEKDVLHNFNSLPPEKIFNPVERKKVTRKLNDIEAKKADLRKAAEIRSQILRK